jgi:CRISPR-associated endonuclease Cas3-HD
VLPEGVRVDDMAYDECVKRVVETWPLAYGKCEEGRLVVNVKLEEHSKLTASIMKRLVETRFSPSVIRNILPEVFRRVDPVDFAYTIGLLHDIGKASTYYLERYVSTLLERSREELDKKLSFPYHEVVLALIMLHATEARGAELNETSLAAIDLGAKVVSRHHSAMPDRHPLECDLRSCKTSRDLREALKNMCKSEVVNLVDRLRDSCNDLELCSEVLSVLDMHLRDVKNCLELSRSFSIPFNKLVEFRSVSGMPRLDALAVYRLVVVYTGALIVADNIAAFREGRESDERGTPLFVKHWVRELSGVLD